MTSLHAGGGQVDEALPGGLVGMGTLLDPSLTKSDGLVGSFVGKPGTLPPVLSEVGLDIQLFDTVIGSREMESVAIERGCTFAYLEVRMNNAAAIGMYKNAGYGILHVSKRYYIDGDDAYVMHKELL